MSLILSPSSKRDLVAVLHRFLWLTMFPRISNPEVQQITDHLLLLQQGSDNLHATVKLETFPIVKRTVISITLDQVDHG